MRPLWTALLLASCSPDAPDAADCDTGHANEAPAQVADALPEPLEVRYLAVGGLSFTVGDDRVLTAPLYSNPGLFAITLGSIETRPEVIDRHLDPSWVEGAAGILVGHAHYDHLMDAPHVQELAGGPPIYGNRSVNWILGQGEVMNDPADPLVDMRMCSEPDPCTGLPSGGEGAWVHLPDSDIRVRALCSSHPAQFLDTVHFGEGCIDAPLDELPTRAEDWREGATLAWLIDFLGPDGEPDHRIYYQDAPTDAPVGHVHPDLLAEKDVDLAVLNVGSYDAVEAHPAAILANLAPRYVLGVHWEDFFRTLDEEVQPIPFHASVTEFDARIDASLYPSDELPVRVDGELVADRYWRPMPGTPFTFEPEGACAPR